MNILRQEIEGTRIYLEVLHKATAHIDNGEQESSNNISRLDDSSQVEASSCSKIKEELKLKEIAEQKLVSFCGQILKEASSLQPSSGEAVHADVHRVLVLRAPVIVKVSNPLVSVTMHVFHLRFLFIYEEMTLMTKK